MSIEVLIGAVVGWLSGGQRSAANDINDEIRSLKAEVVTLRTELAARDAALAARAKAQLAGKARATPEAKRAAAALGVTVSELPSVAAELEVTTAELIRVYKNRTKEEEDRAIAELRAKAEQMGWDNFVKAAMDGKIP
jgi:ATP-dependent protease ClpP protease subunit